MMYILTRTSVPYIRIRLPLLFPNSFPRHPRCLYHQSRSSFGLNVSSSIQRKDLFGQIPDDRSLSRTENTIKYTLFNVCNHHRLFHTSGGGLFDKDSSKVETTVKALKEETQRKQDQPMSKENQLEKRVDEVANLPPKRSIGKRIWDEIVHYYHGFRLLFIDVKISYRLIMKVLNGEDLTRREHKQLVRTVADMFRLLPFSVFIIVPFMEFLLPVFLKLFPNMLPSTFQSAIDRESKFKKQLKMKLEMAKFLQNTLDEMALQSKGETHSHSAKEFAEFFEKIRKSGNQATNEEIMKFSKLFEDEITLDTLSRPQLIALCRLLELQPIGTNNFLRFQLKMQLRSLKNDDKMISKEGVLSLTVPELQQACRARGMRALGVAEDRLRSQLEQWLELSLNEQIPPSLLLLSRVLYLPENITPTDQLKATIQSLPEEAATEARYKIGETEGKIDNKTKIELLKQEEEAIKKEKEEIEAEKQKVKIEDSMKDKAEVIVDKALEMGAHDKPEPQPVIELSKEDLESLEDAIEHVSKEKKDHLMEKEDLRDLKEEMADYKEDIQELKEITETTGNKQLKESKASKLLRRKVDKMIENMDGLLDNLEGKRKTLQEKLDTMVELGEEANNERSNLIGINELLEAVKKLQKVGDDTKLQRIIDVLDHMDVDHDGLVDIEHVVKVLELLSRENVKLSPGQTKDIIKLLIQEELLEDEQRELKRKKEEVSPGQEKTL